jgi:hypothetical protein
MKSMRRPRFLSPDLVHRPVRGGLPINLGIRDLAISETRLSAEP